MCTATYQAANAPDDDAQGTQWGDEHSWGERICCKVCQLPHHHGQEACPPYGLSQVAKAPSTCPNKVVAP